MDPSPARPSGSSAPSGPERADAAPSADAPPAHPGTPAPWRSREAVLVAGLVLLALVLRLPTAGVQSFWLDEVYTGRIVDGSLGHAWSTIQRTENTPPLFYLLDWGWSRLFGTSELALRSLSALAGSLAVLPVVALTRRVAGDAGRSLPLAAPLAAGALMAVNPLAQWFGQEARSYALFLLTSGVAWAALLAALERPDRRRLWPWAAAAVAASWTHYFGGLLFVVGWGALAVAATTGAGGRRPAALRPLALPALVSAACVAALAPIAANQQSTDMYQAISLVKGLGARIVELPKQFAVGYNAPAEYVLGAVLLLVLGVLVLAAAWPRDGRPTRATLLLGLVAAVWLLPVLALVVGFDVVLTRNYVLLIPPLAGLAALGAWRLGRRAWVALGVVGLAQVATIVVVALTPVDQREDWRGVMAAVDDGQPAPALLFMSGYQGPAATYYSPDLKPAPPGPLTVRTIAVADRLQDGVALRPVAPPVAAPGFRLVREVQEDQYRVFVFRARVATEVPQDVVQQLLAPGRLQLLRLR